MAAVRSEGKDTKKKSPILWVLKKVRRRIPLILVRTAFIVGQALLDIAFALGSRNVIDCATSGNQEAFLGACIQQGVIILGLITCMTMSGYMHDRLDAILDRDWKKMLFHDLLHGDYASVSKYHSAELLNRLGNDVRLVDEGLLNVFPSVASMLTRLFGVMTVLIAMEPWFCVAVVAAGVVISTVTNLLRRKLKEIHKQVSAKNDKVSALLQESIEKLLMVQSMDVSDEVEHRSDILLEQRYRMQCRLKNVSLFMNLGVRVLGYFSGFGALLWCSVGLLQGTTSFGTLTAVTQLVSQLQSPVVGLSRVMPQFISMTAAAERMMELDDIQGEPAPVGESAQSMYNRMDYIGGEGISFSYDRDKVLENASFSLPKGAFAVVTGPSGIGKSTLLKLLLGIFHMESGRLFLGCKDEKITLDRSTRRLFAYVPQDNLLLSGTIRENLLIVKPEATKEELEQALYVSAMDDFLPQLPQGLDTPLGESGAGLSGGQAQRLAIARAILGGAPILLLDESTSALDEATEQKVLDRIRSLPDRTCIAVTHRPATQAMSDWKLEMNDGQIMMIKL